MMFKGRKKDKFELLILGAGRGGTSLTAALIDHHPDWEIAMEKHAVRELMEQGSAIRFFKACRKDAQKSRKRWGNKITTEQIANLAPGQWRAFVEEAGKRKLLFVLRDGRACVYSKINRAGLTEGEAIARWKKSVAIYKQLSATHSQFMTLKYEDLTTANESSLKRVCEFLECDFDPQMLQGTQSSKLRPEYQQAEVRQNENQNWPGHWKQEMQEELEELGYL